MNKKTKKGGSEKYPREVQKYLKEIGKLPVLTPEEEKELAKEIEKEKKWGDSEARKKLARANLKLVINIADYYKSRAKKLSLLDLIYEGNLGLFRTVELYDWRSDYRFSTFATLVIRSAIFRVLEDEKK